MQFNEKIKHIASVIVVEKPHVPKSTLRLCCDKYNDLHGNYKIICTRINKIVSRIRCFHFVSIVYFLLLCCDFSSFTSNFNDYGSSVITVYVLIYYIERFKPERSTWLQ